MLRIGNRTIDIVKQIGPKSIAVPWFSYNTAANKGSSLKSFDSIPGPRQLPLIGNLLSLKQLGGEYDILDNIEFVDKLQKTYGDLVRWSLFGTKEIFMFNPDHMKIVMQQEPISPMRREISPYIIFLKKRNIQNALINANGEEWKKLRSASNPIVARPQTVALYLPKYNTILNEFIELLKKSEQNNEFLIKKFEENLKLLALEMNSMVAFDKRINCMNPKETSKEVIDLMESLDLFLKLPFKLLFSLPLWRIYPTQDWKAFEAAGETTYRIGKKYVDEAFERIDKNQENDFDKLTILQQFLLKKDKSKLNIDEISSLMMEFLLAGVDTASTTLHYILYEIACHSSIQQELYEEIQSVCKNDAEITEEMLTKMHFLKLCVKEALRIHNLGNCLTRKLQDDLVIDGYLIPKGTIVNYATYLTSRSERNFKNALEFNPKRFLTEKDTINSFSSLPFGHGARSCIGRRLAEQEIYLIIIKLLQNYKIEYTGEEMKKFWAFFIYPAKTLDLKFIRR